MIFKQLFDEESCTYTYLIASGPGREAIIIDPVLANIKAYTALLRDLKIKLAFTLDTHIHADHITASGLLKQELDCQYIMGEYAQVDCVDLKVRDSDIINFDGFKLKALFTPGHTSDSFSFIFNQSVFTGDTLLINATGRTDFQNGDSVAQYDSLFNKLLKLPSDTVVYPAHDYNGKTSSTIGCEIENNPRLQVGSVSEYVELMSNLNLSLPRYIDVAVPANQRGGFI